MPDLTATVARLFIYPVKSCAGIELREAVLTEAGFALDRAWMVVDAQGEFMTQRVLPRMALIRPEIGRDALVLRAPAMPELRLPLEAAGTPRAARVWDDTVSAFDMGDAAARWFSECLGRPLRLVRFDPRQRRLSSMAWTGGVEASNLFSDGFPVLVSSVASLELLNARLAAAGHGPVTMERFRPNLVLAGIEAHDEDRLGTLHIAAAGGEVALRLVKPCARCPIPNIDPATAESAPAVGDTLQSYRQDPRLDGAITFGMNAIVLHGAGCRLQLGQSVAADFQFD